MDLRRHLMSGAVLAFFLALNTATSKAPSPYPGPPPTVTPPLDAGVVYHPADARGAADDLDLSAAQAAAGCPKAGDVCRILGEFAAAKTPTDLPPMSVGSYVFAGYTYGSGTPRAPYFVKIQRGYTPSPIPSLDPDVMDVSAARRAIRPEQAADADAWIAAVRGGAPAPAGNRAAEIARTYSPTDYFAMVSTRGASIAVLADATPPHVFLRASGAKLLMIEHAPGGTVSHEKVTSKLFATEMWKALK